MLAFPVESFGTPTPSLPTGLILKEDKKTFYPRYTAHELSGPLEDDLRAHFTWHVIAEIRAEMDVFADRFPRYLTIPLRAESLAQLCDIYK